MQKFSSKQRAKMPAEQSPYISSNEIGINEINGAVPKGYRLLTIAESEIMYRTNSAFKADLDIVGGIWVLGNKEGKPSPVCARAYCGLFRVDNPAGKDYRPVTNTAYVAYVRDERISISRQAEQMVSLKNALRREVHSILY